MNLENGPFRRDFVVAISCCVPTICDARRAGQAILQSASNLGTPRRSVSPTCFPLLDNGCRLKSQQVTLLAYATPEARSLNFRPDQLLNLYIHSIIRTASPKTPSMASDLLLLLLLLHELPVTEKRKKREKKKVSTNGFGTATLARCR